MLFPPPPEVLASWPAPNYINPESRGPAIIVVGAITLSLAVIALLLRLYVKFGMLRKPGWDDYLMILATAAGTGMTTTVILANTHYGWNHHIWDLHLTELVTARKVSLVAQVLYLLCTSLAKVSILLSYLTLAPPQTYFRSLSQIAIVVIAIGNTAFFILLFTQCIPTSSYWNLFRINQDCHLRESQPLMAQAVMTILADVAVWILPLPTFYYARLPLGQRVALIVLFSFGGVVVVAACLRTYWLWWAVGVTWDVTWQSRNEWIWTAVEVHLGIICGCVPWLKSFFNLWRTRQERPGTAYAQKIGSGRDMIRPSDGLSGPRHKPTYSWTVNTGLGPWEDHDRDLDGIDLEERHKKSFGEGV